MEKDIKPNPVSPEIKNTNIKTYVGDMTKVLDSNKEGMVRNLIHEQERNEDEKRNLSPESKKNKKFMVIGLVLLLLGVITFLAFLFFKERISTVEIAPQFKSLIYADTTSFLEIGGMDNGRIAKTIFGQVNVSKISTREVEGVYLTENKKIIGIRRLITLLKGGFIPGDNIFVNDYFLMGITNKDAKNLFILLKVRSFPDVFPSLHEWEKKMFNDLHGFWGISINADTNYLLTKEFEDGVVNNQNGRILYDKDGNIVMLYVFADNNSVVITNTEASAREVMLRLISGEIKK